MPNSLSAAGLILSTREELITYYTEQYQNIYGADINLESDTPDGQMMNINVQAVLDMQDLLSQIYNSFNPDTAIGIVLDQRVAINGIQRQAGTYTITPVTVVVSQSVNLYGLDQDTQEVYTVSDNSGNRWFLEETQLGVTVGSHSYSFRAEEPGANLTIPNTITIPVTIVLGVVSVNNPTAATTVGVNEESDAALKVRRQRSVSLASQGYLAGLLAALENIEGMTSAFVYENNTDITDSDGVPSHSIWVIVAGTAADADIAQAIYTKRNAGCGMFGTESYTITQIDGSPFTLYWDEVSTVNLFIKFTATSIDGVVSPNVNAIRDGLPALFVPGVYTEVDINGLATEVQTIDGNTLVTQAGFSLGVDQRFTLSGIAASGTFKINYNGNETAAINWNDSVGTIQTKLQAVTGLASATVTGSIASQVLDFDLSTVGNVLALLYVTDNSLATSAPAAITFGFNSVGYTDTLIPASKVNQFIVSSDNIIITPMILSPSVASIAALGTQQFLGYGGYGELTYSISINNSGGSIDSSTGFYTAGAVTSVTDTIQVADKFANTATATIVVTA